MVSIAIVGLGPWGVCALERIVTTAREGSSLGSRIAVHVIEPRLPGAGVYDPAQPDYLLLNNPCGQLSLYPFGETSERPPYGIGLFEWAVARGYRWVGDRCVVGRGGEPIEPHHFLPRRLMGEYLHWFYIQLRRSAPRGVEIVHHRAEAVDVIGRRDGRELVCLSDGRRVVADHVILTPGHTANRRAPAPAGIVELEPYPVAGYVDRLGAEDRVAVSGMGLVAIDVVIALTVGRGGRFVERAGALRYRASGREPTLRMFSRSGLPFTAKSVTGIDRTGVYRPVICTPEAFEELVSRRLVDVRAELLPLLFAEMSARYYAQVAYQTGSLSDARQVRERLRGAWERGSFDAELAGLAGRFGRFDPEELFFGPRRAHRTSGQYAHFVYDSLARDLREAEVPDGASPVKSATEVLRIFRDPMRSVVEQGGISLDSYLDFNSGIRSRIHRLVAGPPAIRSRQLLALVDAGVLSMPYGPSPSIRAAAPDAGDPRGTLICSTALERPISEPVSAVVRGHLDEPRLRGSASRLLRRLYRSGRLSQFCYGDVRVGSVDLTPESHPISVDGAPQQRLWVFGVLTEGIRHFTHYIPSPRSRIRAFEDIGACVGQILGEAAATGDAAPGALLVEQVA